MTWRAQKNVSHGFRRSIGAVRRYLMKTAAPRMRLRHAKFPTDMAAHDRWLEL